MSSTTHSGATTSHIQVTPRRPRLLNGFFPETGLLGMDIAPTLLKSDFFRLGVSAVIIGGTAFGINAFMNREKRVGGLSPQESAHLNQTFLYAGTGLGMTAITAKLLHNSGWSYKLMSMNPWLMIGGSLALSIGTMYGTVSTPVEQSGLKHLCWAGFNVVQAGVLAPMYFYAPAVLARAALYTTGIVGSLAFVGATAKETQYLYMGGPLLAGVTVVALSGLAPLILPAGSRALNVTEKVWMYGGLAVFSGFVLYDTQRVSLLVPTISIFYIGAYHFYWQILAAARYAQLRGSKPDPIAQAISIELDAINIFVSGDYSNVLH